MPDDCRLSSSESEFLALLRRSPRQARTRLRCSAELSAFAEARARDMADQGYFSHVTPERRGPNWLLKRSGYPLPTSYGGVLSNSVESIAAGYADPRRVWAEFLASPGHRAHVLAEADFYARQDEVGIAHIQAPDSDYGDYWVVVIARRKQPGEPHFLCLPDSGTCFAFGPR